VLLQQVAQKSVPSATAANQYTPAIWTANGQEALYGICHRPDDKVRRRAEQIEWVPILSFGLTHRLGREGFTKRMARQGARRLSL
jgi:hypothetical protein